MNSTTAAIDNLDIERLNDSDKGELRQFLQTQQQRSQIQSRMFSRPPPNGGSSRIYPTALAPMAMVQSDETNNVRQKRTS